MKKHIDLSGKKQLELEELIQTEDDQYFNSHNAPVKNKVEKGIKNKSGSAPNNLPIMEEGAVEDEIEIVNKKKTKNNNADKGNVLNDNDPSDEEIKERLNQLLRGDL